MPRDPKELTVDSPQKWAEMPDPYRELPQWLQDKVRAEVAVRRKQAKARKLAVAKEMLLTVGPMPMPFTWLHSVRAIPGAASLAVGLAIWFQVEKTGATTVTLDRTPRRLFVLDRHTVARGLAGLEAAGLVSVSKAQGRPSRITVCRVDEVE